MTRDEALLLLDKKLHPYWIGIVVCIPVVPVTVFLLQCYALWRADMAITVETLTPGQVFWTPLMYVIIAVSSSLLIWRAKKRIKAIRPILESGEEVGGWVDSVGTSQASSKGVILCTLDAQVSLSDGRRLNATITEPVGTPLPDIEAGAVATAWIHGASAVVGVGDGLLQSKAM